MSNTLLSTKYLDTLVPWLTVMEYLCNKWPRICSTCRKHFPVLSSFMTYHRVCNLIKTTGASSRAGTAYPFGSHEFIPVFSEVRGTRSFSFMCMFCRSLFVHVCFSFWPLRCLFFNIPILIVPLVSSNSSSSLVTENHQRSDVYFPAHAW